MAEPRRMGRPPVDATARQPSADVHLRLPARDYDRAERVGKSRRETIQDTLRRALKRLLEDERG